MQITHVHALELEVGVAFILTLACAKVPPAVKAYQRAPGTSFQAMYCAIMQAEALITVDCMLVTYHLRGEEMDSNHKLGSITQRGGQGRG